VSTNMLVRRERMSSASESNGTDMDAAWRI